MELLIPLAAPGRFTTMDANLLRAKNRASSRSMGPLKRFYFCFEVFTLVNLSY